VPFQLRDHHGASRSVAYLTMTAAPFLLLTGVVFAPASLSDAMMAASGAVAVVLAAVGVLCRWQVDRVPRLFWLLAPLLAAVVITGLNLGTRDASTGAQMFYLWPVLYAANFLSRTTIGVTLALVSAGNAAVVFRLLPVTTAVSDWGSLTVAMTLTTIIVASLRHRNDRLREVLETQAFADALTGVANRRGFDGELHRAAGWARHTGRSIALLTLDVDHFKEINDGWGHGAGDQALRLVATALRTVAKGDEDVVARLGGDEFVVLLRADRAGARRAADDIRAAVAAIDGLPGGPPGVSIGVALLPDHAGTAEELGAASDAALYAAKSGGRGRAAMAPPAPRHNLDQVPRRAGVFP
jgi:diguanylate cyclase (GGDEF)-like protein